MIKRILHMVLLLMMICPISAQIIYECDFEDENERNQWVLNPTANEQKKAELTNFWNMGLAGHFAPKGEWGLFIGTSENATEAEYNGTKSIETVAYRNLPTLQPGKYVLTFTWIAKCKAGKEGVHALLVPQDVNTYSGGTALTMAWYKPNIIPMSADTVLHGTTTWSIATDTFQLKQAGDYKLVLLFYTTKGAVLGPAPCIDDISMFVADQCEAPSKITHTIEGADVRLKWEGMADSYDIRTYNYERNVWQEFTTTENTYLVPNMDEGIGVFFLRSHCGDKHSEWIKLEKFIYHKGDRCIDYMELTNKTCAYGTFQSPGSSKGVVDFGYADMLSRHTLHYVPGEIDSWTVEGPADIGLQTKPDDALASVRLGNWNIGSEAEQITYTYTVPEKGKDILELRYAVVMENPEHNPEAQPRFTLSIKHNGKKLDGGCGEADFVAGNELNPSEGWHINKVGSHTINWKEWTTVSVNLRDYVGETISITLTTYDCSQSGHFGYAYFVLDCKSGEMTGLNCGDSIPTTTFTAPDGFDYRWYLADDPGHVKGTQQVFTIDPLDTALYAVDVISKTNAECYYTLHACGMPRIPMPVVEFSTKVQNCKNIATFRNSSCVYVRNQITDRLRPSNEGVTTLIWDFGDGEVTSNLDSVLTHTYPINGGTYRVAVTAGISDDACLVTKEYYITFPNLSQDTTQLLIDACRKDYPYGYNYEGKTYYNDIDSLYTLTSIQTGCDSSVHFVLRWHEPGPFDVTDTVCEGFSYDFFGRSLTQAGVYDTTVVSSFGCDSMIHLSLHVVPRLTVDYPSETFVCADNPTWVLPYTVTKGFLGQIEVRFHNANLLGLDSVYIFRNGEPVEIVFPDSLSPSQLQADITFATSSCPIPDAPILIELRYSSSVFMQKEGMLALMNKDFIGYDFVEFQWYRDDQKIEGATYPYLSATEQDKGHSYRVVVRVNGSDQWVSTCDLVYTGVMGINDLCLDDGSYRVFTVLGNYVMTIDNLNQMTDIASGIYILYDGTNAFKMVR